MKRLPLPLLVARRFVLGIVELFWIPFYHLIGLLPRNKNLWIFVSWFGMRYSDNTRVFFEWVNKNHPEIKTVWLSKNPDVVKDVRVRGFNAFKNNSLKDFYKTSGGQTFLLYGSRDFLQAYKWN